MKNKFFIMGCFLAVAACFTGCKNDDKEKDVLATAITVTPETLQGTGLQVGDEVTLTATLTPANASTKDINWLSENESVAKLTGTGLTVTVKCMGEGKTNIKVYNTNTSVNIPVQVGAVSPAANAYFDLANVTGGKIEFTWLEVPGVAQYKIVLSESATGAAIETFGPFTGSSGEIQATAIDATLFEAGNPAIEMNEVMPVKDDFVKSLYWKVVSAADASQAITEPRTITFVKILDYPTWIGMSTGCVTCYEGLAQEHDHEQGVDIEDIVIPTVITYEGDGGLFIIKVDTEIIWEYGSGYAQQWGIIWFMDFSPEKIGQWNNGFYQGIFKDGTLGYKDLGLVKAYGDISLDGIPYEFGCERSYLHKQLEEWKLCWLQGFFFYGEQINFLK